ncbi:serine hydrolase [Streptomyces sp. NPDC090108]|uniref:serine hydrolase n=1 Tax=Streptomyces sp. NPDC090108 TaxID=3365947 RepID=UPI00380E74D1
MPYPLHRPKYQPRPARTRSRGGRTAVSGVVTAAATALLVAGALHATPATAAPLASAGQAASRTGSSSPSPSFAGSHASGFAASVRAEGQARVTAAVLDLDARGGKTAVYGEDAPYDTASIIKVDILATALLQAEDSGHPLTTAKRAQAKAMIEHSDNASANALWRHIGRADGLEAANKRLGLKATRGGPDARWGLTRTTASDQIRLLRALFDAGPADGTAGGSAAKPGHGPALGTTSRAYVRKLMGQVADEQSWGVSAAGGTHGSGHDPKAALKNGWLQRNSTGLWDINSVGRITSGGHHYLVAVLSDGNKSMKDGVALVERAARTAVSSTNRH